MRKFVFLAAAFALSTALGAASAQTPARPPAQTPAPPAPAAAAAPRPQQAEPEQTGPQQIEPANALENAFLAALTNPEMRPVFRHLLLESQVAVALTGSGADAAPLGVPIQNNVQAAAIYTSPSRLAAILGDDAPHAVVTGRVALTRLRHSPVALNFGWAPMLTLDPADITRYLETPEAPGVSLAPEQAPEAPVAAPGIAGPTQ